MGSLVRLNAALDWIDEFDLLADIGCDHGYLAIEALKKGIPFIEVLTVHQLICNTHCCSNNGTLRWLY